MYIFIQCWKKSSRVCAAVLSMLPLLSPTYLQCCLYFCHKHLQPHYFRPLQSASHEGIETKDPYEGAQRDEVLERPSF